MTTEEFIGIIIFVVAAFLPPIIYMWWIRNTEKYGKEPWLHIIKVFVWGAVIAVFIAIILSVILLSVYQIGIERIYVGYGENPTLDLLILAVVIAPFTEEFAKGLGVYSVRNEITEEEDGLVYGASCGLGFAATENLMYGVIAYLEGGWGGFFAVIIVRSIASALLHGSATSVMGLGIAKSIMSGERTSVFPYYLAAVGMHASFNFLASLGVIYENTYGTDTPYGSYIHIFSLMIVILFAVLSIGVIRKKIKKSDSSRLYPYYKPWKYSRR